METKTRFNAKIYLDQLKRCDIHTIAHLENAINQDLDMSELQMLCRFFNTNAGGVVKAVAKEIGVKAVMRGKPAGGVQLSKAVSSPAPRL